MFSDFFTLRCFDIHQLPYAASLLPRQALHPSIELLRRCGFRYRGNVLVEVEDGHDPRRMAYEKRLKRE